MLTSQQKRQVFLYVALLYLFSWGSIKLCLPALPQLSHNFSHGDFYTKLSISTFFYTFALSMPFWGSLSEYIGRVKSLSIAFVLAAIGSLIVVFAHSGLMFVIGRTVEGLAMGVVSPVGRAMIADIFVGDTFAKKMSLIGMVVWTVPAIAPIFGGWLLLVASWRIIFILALLVAVVFFFYTKTKLTETHHPKEKIGNPVKNYLTLFCSRLFWCYAISYGLLTGGVLSYYTAMPFWFVGQWHVSTHTYGFLGIATVIGYIGGLLSSNFLLHLHKTGRWVVKRFEEDGLIFLALLIGVVMVLVAFGVGEKINNSITFIIVVMTLFAFCAGLAMPSINAMIMRQFRYIAGPATASTALVVYLVTGVITAITTNMQVHTIWPVLLFTGGATVISAILIKLAP